MLCLMLSPDMLIQNLPNENNISEQVQSKRSSKEIPAQLVVYTAINSMIQRRWKDLEQRLTHLAAFSLVSSQDQSD